MTNKNIKLGFTKSKAYGLCGVILTAALLAIMAPNAHADEVTSAQPTTETVTPAQPVTETPATETVAPATETPATEVLASNAEETPTVEKAPTEVSKEGTTITVKNPDVDMHFTKGETGNGTANTSTSKSSTRILNSPTQCRSIRATKLSSQCRRKYPSGLISTLT